GVLQPLRRPRGRALRAPDHLPQERRGRPHAGLVRPSWREPLRGDRPQHRQGQAHPRQPRRDARPERLQGPPQRPRPAGGRRPDGREEGRTRRPGAAGQVRLAVPRIRARRGAARCRGRPGLFGATPTRREGGI
ncbi:MAG: hypothetical protein AVDCRST_MAG22-1443, partial [uncultured Rubrobacteraceae bacterium]